MDRITKSYLTEFSINYGFESEKDETKLFEHFINYIILEHKTEENFEIEDIGMDNSLGIDGFALIINKNIIEDEDELDDLLKLKDISADVVFIQSKTSKNFETKEIGNFGWAVQDFISEKHKLPWPKIAKEKIFLFEKLLTNSSKLRNKPNCYLYYATLGKKVDDNTIGAKLDDIKKDIELENLFEKVTIDLLDTNEIQNLYKKIDQAVCKSFEFPQRVVLPEIDNVQESYLGIVKAKTIVELMTDDNGEFLSNVFYDNIRDYQGDNKVNKEIANTLNSPYKNAFLILNNGITIIADKIETTRNMFTISNYQIINGCQTSNVLFDNKDKIDDKVLVPIKLINTQNQDITAKLIRSTNRQTEIKEQDLIAYSNFQKKLEDFYKTFPINERLYYERRSKQYSKASNVNKKRIVDKTIQIKSVASFYYNKPDMATRYFGAVFNELKKKLFDDNHKLLPYYTATYILYKIDDGFRRNIIDKKYKKIKYFILMMIRYEIDSGTIPAFNSNKMDVYCDKILKNINSENDYGKIIKRITQKIDKLKINLDDKEISKSKKLVQDCLNFYN